MPSSAGHNAGHLPDSTAKGSNAIITAYLYKIIFFKFNNQILPEIVTADHKQVSPHQKVVCAILLYYLPDICQEFYRNHSKETPEEAPEKFI